MLELINISKSFPGASVKSKANQHETMALKKVDLFIKEGEFFSLLGPSGCGKTTLLRIISGLETQSSGDILLDGNKINHLSIQNRPFNMVFQSYALFPHLNVKQNLKFGLELKKISSTDIKKRVDSALDLVNLGELQDRYPETLSGGQAQRVALARALVNRPKILLLDEPLSALDLKLRQQLRTELLSLQKQIGLTFIFVTHDQEEALTLSDRIAIMNKGSVEQVGAPSELYEAPKTEFAAKFLGNMNSFYAKYDNNELLNDFVQLEKGNRLKVNNQFNSFSKQEKIQIFIRPEKVNLKFGTNAVPGENEFIGKVILNLYQGVFIETHLSVEGLGILKVICSTSELPALKEGNLVRVQIHPKDIHLFGAIEA